MGARHWCEVTLLVSFQSGFFFLAAVVRGSALCVFSLLCVYSRHAGCGRALDVISALVLGCYLMRSSCTDDERAAERTYPVTSVTTPHPKCPILPVLARIYGDLCNIPPPVTDTIGTISSIVTRTNHSLPDGIISHLPALSLSLVPTGFVPPTSPPLHCLPTFSVQHRKTMRTIPGRNGRVEGALRPGATGNPHAPRPDSFISAPHPRDVAA